MAGVLLGTIGDPSLVFDGGVVYQYGAKRFELEWVEVPHASRVDDPKARWMVYTVVLEPEIPDWGDLSDVAKDVGQSMMRIAAAFHSSHAMDRALAYQMWAHLYGWKAFGPKPDRLTKRQVEQRYNLQLGSPQQVFKFGQDSLTGVTPIKFYRKQRSVVIVTDQNDYLEASGSSKYGTEAELLTGHGTQDVVRVYRVGDDTIYYVLAYNTQGVEYVGLAAFEGVLPSSPPWKPTGEIFLQSDDEIEDMFPEGLRNTTEDEMVGKLQEHL